MNRFPVEQFEYTNDEYVLLDEIKKLEAQNVKLQEKKTKNGKTLVVLKKMVKISKSERYFKIKGRPPIITLNES